MYIEDRVQIECGRATVDLPSMTIRYNFYNSPSRKITSATWFTKDSNNRGADRDKSSLLSPLPMADGAKVEVLYQQAVAANSSLGSGLDSLLRVEVTLSDNETEQHQQSPPNVVVVAKSGGSILMKKRPRNPLSSVFGQHLPLQRGYGPYIVDGEEEELTLGPVRHLVFVVHGIGEALFSRDDVSVSSLVAEVNKTRATIHKRQVDGWKRKCEKARKTGNPLPDRPGRIELLPIEWYNQIHSSSSSLKKTLVSATPPGVSRLRTIANDVIFDVLMYMTPEFCHEVLDCVTKQIYDLFVGFNTVHEHFLDEGGKCSLIGHSLGSVIVWDMLSLLGDALKTNEQLRSQYMETTGTTAEMPIVILDNDSPPFEELLKSDDEPTICVDGVPIPLAMSVEADDDSNNHHNKKKGTWRPTLSKPIDTVIPFIPEFTFFLGSPLGIFLSLRGAHSVFNEMRLANQTATTKAPSPFVLPSRAIYNIFHPSDPVAYRIEPLLLSPGTKQEDIPPPAFLVAETKGVRLHVMAKEMGDNFRKSLTRSIRGNFDKVSEAAAVVSDLIHKDEKRKSRVFLLRESKKNDDNNDGELKFALGGMSSRVDYHLQTGVIENEYISAVTAHSGYFSNEDVLDFLIQTANVG